MSQPVQPIANLQINFFNKPFEIDFPCSRYSSVLLFAVPTFFEILVPATALNDNTYSIATKAALAKPININIMPIIDKVSIVLLILKIRKLLSL